MRLIGERRVIVRQEARYCSGELLDACWAGVVIPIVVVIVKTDRPATSATKEIITVICATALDAVNNNIETATCQLPLGKQACRIYRINRVAVYIAVAIPTLWVFSCCAFAIRIWHTK